MSAEHREIPEPGELVYAPRPSFLPALLAFALAVVVCGVYAEGFMVRGWVYALIAGIAALFFFRGLVRNSVREFFRLPLRQKVRGAVLPVETIQTPAKR
jgi:hypothetical protein